MRLFLLTVSLMLASIAQSSEPKARQPDAVVPVAPDYVPGVFRGKVVAFGTEKVTIQPEGDVKIDSFSFHPDGNVKEVRRYVQDNSQPAKVFTFSDSLLDFNGTLPPNRRGGVNQFPRCGQHKVSDLKAGDVVFINYRRVQGEDICTEVHILRRPGGRVPAAHYDDKTSPKNRVEFLRNRDQFIGETIGATFGPRLLRAITR